MLWCKENANINFQQKLHESHHLFTPKVEETKIDFVEKISGFL